MNIKDAAYLEHVMRLENLKVAVVKLQTAIFERGIHHIDARIRYDEMIAALNKINEHKGAQP